MALEHLAIHNFAIIDRLDIELQDGLTVITGETGAGKSIVVRALTLLLGERTGADVIRHGEDRCEIAAEFSVADGSAAQAWLRKQELSDDDRCLIRRIIRRDKAAKCYINDRPATLASLRELGRTLVDIHGQHEHQSLLRAPEQRRILDRYAGITEQVSKLGARYRTIRDLESQLERALDDRKHNSDRVDLLNFQTGELLDAELQAGEFSELEAEHRRLGHANELAQGLQGALSALYDAEDGSVSSGLGAATQELARLSDYDARVAEPLEMLGAAMIQIEEAAPSLRQLLDASELDPARLDWVEKRMDTLIALARKHRRAEDELPALLGELQAELSLLQEAEHDPDTLRQRLDTETARYRDAAKQIRRARTRAADKLSTAVSAEMQKLGMQGGALEIVVDPGEDQVMGEYGTEQIEFRVRTNPGQPARPLVKIASGGELSRISLAIEVVTSASQDFPTLLFDEVDVGVGGKVAEIVGRQLRSLAADNQVLSVTHLPQVAAQGHQQLLVKKTADAGKDATYSEVVALNDKQRVTELARMLGGKEITERTLAHAEEMLKKAS